MMIRNIVVSTKPLPHKLQKIHKLTLNQICE